MPVRGDVGQTRLLKCLEKKGSDVSIVIVFPPAASRRQWTGSMVISGRAGRTRFCRLQVDRGGKGE